MPNAFSGPEPTQEPLRVAYILKMFPRLSETFILNEILELEAQGVEVTIISLMYPNDGRFHGRLGGLKARIETFTRDKPEEFWTQSRAEGRPCPEFAKWEGVYEYAHKWAFPKDVEITLRSVAIATRLQELGVQHIHAHFATISTRVAAMVNMLTGIPFSFTSHAKDIFRETVDRELYKDLVDRSAFNITVSDFNRRFILDHTPGVDADKVVRLYNGIDLDFFHPDRTSRSRHASETQDETHIVSVGRLVPKKGFDYLLQALRQWKDQGRPFRCTIVGDGEDREKLLALRRQLGLEDTVEFAGALSQESVLELCGQATMMVLACVPDELNNMDALPTTLLEALALDLPIVSTTLTGVPEIVGEEAGIVVEPGNAEALAHGMLQVDDRIRSGSISAGISRARAERLFDLKKNAGTLKEHFVSSARGG